MGSPGPFTWRGTIFAIEVGGNYIDRDKTVYIGPLSETPEPIDKYSYVGKFWNVSKWTRPPITNFRDECGCRALL